MKTTIAILLAISMLALVGCQHSPVETATEQKPPIENHAPSPAGENQLPVASSSTNVEHPQEITREVAEKIALDHAGLSADAVTRLHTEYDRDRINHYEVNFYHNGYEYDYDIHAETGEILDHEKDFDD